MLTRGGEVLVSVLEQLPEPSGSENLKGSFVIDFRAARDRLVSQEKADLRPGPILAHLDLAVEWQRALKREGVNQADLARRHGVSRARVTQVLALLNLHPRILVKIRTRAAAGERLTERMFRPLLKLPPAAQLAAARRLFASRSADGRRAS